MGSEIELISDGHGLAVVGAPGDVERFFLSTGLDQLPSKTLDLLEFDPQPISSAVSPRLARRQQRMLAVGSS